LVGDEWYAVYASITSNVNTVGLFSPIAYFRTVQWQPPSKPNEPITTYLVYYAPVDDRLPVNSSNVLCLMKDKNR
jgi:hypothetical protein